MNIIYERINSLCEQNGISGYKLCKECGISPSVITDLKMGRKADLSAHNANKIATYFDVSVAYLLGTDNEKPAEICRQDIYAILESLTKEQLLEVATLAMERLKHL